MYVSITTSAPFLDINIYIYIYITFIYKLTNLCIFINYRYNQRTCKRFKSQQQLKTLKNASLLPNHSPAQKVQ